MTGKSQSKLQWLINIIVDIIGTTGLPSGTIILWNGSIETIPSGFVLCDGTNDTPNLVGRFVKGPGDGTGPGETGGSVNHDHDFTTNGHTHDFAAGMGDLADGPDFARTIASNTDSGTTDQINHLPPFHVLAYIMKT